MAFFNIFFGDSRSFSRSKRLVLPGRLGLLNSHPQRQDQAVVQAPARHPEGPLDAGETFRLERYKLSGRLTYLPLQTVLVGPDGMDLLEGEADTDFKCPLPDQASLSFELQEGVDEYAPPGGTAPFEVMDVRGVRVARLFYRVLDGGGDAGTIGRLYLCDQTARVGPKLDLVEVDPVNLPGAYSLSPRKGGSRTGPGDEFKLDCKGLVPPASGPDAAPLPARADSSRAATAAAEAPRSTPSQATVPDLEAVQMATITAWFRG
jgi:hypothetical protein